jgi:NTE family protein
MTPGVAVVLAGGGARGAYEAGVLSVLLPALEAHGMRPDLFMGTSAGAINAVGLASRAHLRATASSSAVLDLWREVHASSVFRGPLHGAFGKLFGRGHDARQARALLDTAPLARTLERVVDWDRLHANVGEDGIAAVGVVATSSCARHSTVFLEAAERLPRPPADAERAIVYVPTVLEARHVLASSAIPLLFPPVEIERPPEAAGWYFDGGVRLNTPIKPALALGAARVVVVATAPVEPEERPLPGHLAPVPGVGTAAARLLHAMLDDRMVEDLRTLALKNGPGLRGRVVPWLFGGPRGHDAGLLGRLVTEVLDGRAEGRGHRGPFRQLTRRALRRVLAGDPSRAELASYLYFDADFIEGAIRLGRRDAEMSLGPGGAPVWHDSRITRAPSA